MNQFPPSPWVSHKGRFEFFRKFVEIFAAQAAPPPVSLMLVANGKNSSLRKVLNILFGHLWLVELTYRWNFFFKFTWMCKSDIMLIICNQCQQPVAKLPLLSLIPVAIDTGGESWLAGIFPRISWHCPFKPFMCHEIFCITLGPFQFFCKFAEIFASQVAPPVSTTPGAKLTPVSTTPAANLPPVLTTPAANFATSFTSVVETGGKFATSVNDTGGKFATCVNNTGGKLPPVSTIPVANNGNSIRLQLP